MYPTASAPQYAFGPGLAPAPMPMYKGGGNVQQTYGLRNAAEQLRERGRGDDTILAHINPQEAGILKLLGGSGTINPYTGLPEYSIRKFLKRTPIVKEVYKVGSKIGKGIERGVESVAKALGPVGQIAAAYFGGPIGAALYAGLAPPGSSFDVKDAAKAAALTYAGNTLSGAENAWAPKFDYSNAFGGNMSYVPTGDVSSAASGASSVGEAVSIGGSMDASGIGTGVDAAAGGPGYSYTDTLAGTQPITAPPSGIGEPLSQSASAGTTATNAYPPAPTASANALSAGDASDLAATPQGPVETVYTKPTVGVRSVLPDFVNEGIDVADQGIEAAKQGISNVIPDSARQFAREYLPTLSQVKDAATIASLGTTAYGAYKTKQELDDAKAEANRIMTDQANRKKEEVEWAQSVLRDYAYNYQRLTEEEVRRERGMAMGGRINSYDDEIGGDDNMMQGGIASLAKGGLPPRYLRGGGDGMSDSIRASIEGKQEARLADGEFVVPADVVSHLGNGSSNAGAKKLYSMMDRVRRSRTGKSRQAPEVNTRRLMPA